MIQNLRRGRSALCRRGNRHVVASMLLLAALATSAAAVSHLIADPDAATEPPRGESRQPAPADLVAGMVQNDAKEGGESAQAVGQMLVAAGARNDAGKKEAAQAAGEKKGADAASPGRRIAVTGANRGLGLEFVRQYLKRGDRVFALVRKPDEASDLAALSKENPGRLTIVPGDVADDASIEAARKKVSEATDALDILVNNAGTSGARVNDLAGLDLADLRATYEVNAIGPIRVARALVPLLKKGRSPKIVSISSQMGSIENNRSGGAWGYRMSKAALNMANRNLAHALRDDGISCVVLHPGWVRTDMGGPNATLSPEESIRSMIKTIDGVTIEKSGAFFDKDGAVLPW